jgi:glutathione S-transferase
MAETTKRTAEYELHFFEGARGFAQMIRWILLDVNASFTEKLVPFDEFKEKFKEDESFSGVFRTLPVLLVNSTNTRLSQTLAIVSYLGRKYDLYGSDTSSEGLAFCDAICSAAKSDVLDMLVLLLAYHARMSGTNFNSLYDIYSPKIEETLKRLNNLLGDKDYFCGKLSIADFVVFDAFEAALLVFGQKLALKYPNLAQLFDRLKARPRIKEYRESDRMPVNIILGPKYNDFIAFSRERFALANAKLVGEGAGFKKGKEKKKKGGEKTTKEEYEEVGLSEKKKQKEKAQMKKKDKPAATGGEAKKPLTTA